MRWRGRPGRGTPLVRMWITLPAFDAAQRVRTNHDERLVCRHSSSWIRGELGQRWQGREQEAVCWIAAGAGALIGCASHDTPRGTNVNVEMRVRLLWTSRQHSPIPDTSKPRADIDPTSNTVFPTRVASPRPPSAQSAPAPLAPANLRPPQPCSHPATTRRALPGGVLIDLVHCEVFTTTTPHDNAIAVCRARPPATRDCLSLIIARVSTASTSCSRTFV